MTRWTAPPAPPATHTWTSIFFLTSLGWSAPGAPRVRGKNRGRKVWNWILNWSSYGISVDKSLNSLKIIYMKLSTRRKVGGSDSKIELQEKTFHDCTHEGLWTLASVRLLAHYTHMATAWWMVWEEDWKLGFRWDLMRVEGKETRKKVGKVFRWQDQEFLVMQLDMRYHEESSKEWYTND